MSPSAPQDEKTELLLALSVAFHRAGLPSDALEATIGDVARLLAVPAQISAFPTTLTLAIGAGFEQRVVVLRLDPEEPDLRKLAQLERSVAALRAGAEPAAVLADVRSIDAKVPTDPPLLTIGGYAMLSVGAALLLGGGRSEATVSGIVGVAIGIIAAVALRSQSVERVFPILAAFVATAIIGLWERFVAPISLYVTLIAGVVELLPGYSLTTALNELANQNLIAGTARLGKVFVTLLSLVAGFALGSAVVANEVLHAPQISPAGATAATSTAGALFMGLALAAILHARVEDIRWIVGSCIAAVALENVFGAMGLAQAVPFATALAIGLMTNFAARYLRIPRAVVLIPGLLVLVPGSVSYQSLLYLFQADPTDAVSLALRALLAATLIVAGFLTSQLVAPTRRTVTERDV